LQRQLSRLMPHIPKPDPTLPAVPYDGICVGALPCRPAPMDNDSQYDTIMLMREVMRQLYEGPVYTSTAEVIRAGVHATVATRQGCYCVTSDALFRFHDSVPWRRVGEKRKRSDEWREGVLILKFIQMDAGVLRHAIGLRCCQVDHRSEY